jgi:hypothetical protein
LNTADSDANGSGSGGGLAIVGLGAWAANALLADNLDLSPAGEVAPDCTGTVQSGGYSLVEGPAGCGWLAGPGDVTGQDPQLRPSLAAQGTMPGTTLTYLVAALLPEPGSPALDAGSPGAWGHVENACPPSDIYGQARPVGPRCDIGAVERVFKLAFPALLHP